MLRTVLLSAIALGLSLSAQAGQERKGGWFAAELGFGRLNQQSSVGSRTDDLFAGGFRGGYAINRHVLVGLQVNGWLIETANLEDPSKGATLTQVFVITEVYPLADRGLFVKLGAGYTELNDNSPYAFDTSGRGATVGLGYDIRISRRWAISPVINYSWGELDDVTRAEPPILGRDYSAFDVMVAFTLP
jgi:hypothetical protein